MCVCLCKERRRVIGLLVFLFYGISLCNVVPISVCWLCSVNIIIINVIIVNIITIIVTVISIIIIIIIIIVIVIIIVIILSLLLLLLLLSSVLIASVCVCMREEVCVCLTCLLSCIIMLNIVVPIILYCQVCTDVLLI